MATVFWRLRASPASSSTSSFKVEFGTLPSWRTHTVPGRRLHIAPGQLAPMILAKVTVSHCGLPYALTQVIAPGCLQFGRRAFAECCSLCYIGASDEPTNELAPGAQISPYAFESCLALSKVGFEQTGATTTGAAWCMPEGSLCGSGIEQLKLPADFNYLGPLACENCKHLVQADLTSTDISAIWGSTFSYCVNLAHIWLPPKLRRIGKEAFMSCASLQVISKRPLSTSGQSTVESQHCKLLWRRSAFDVARGTWPYSKQQSCTYGATVLPKQLCQEEAQKGKRKSTSFRMVCRWLLQGEACNAPTLQ